MNCECDVTRERERESAGGSRGQRVVIGRCLGTCDELSLTISQLVTMVTINADLRRERERCSFDPMELTSFWDGNAEKTSHRRELGLSSR